MDLLNSIFNLDIFKCRNVKTPVKAWKAAGWDFFIPENLSIFDFTKSYKTYLDESIKHNKRANYEVPLVFYLKSNRTQGEFKLKLILSWNSKINEYEFKFCEKTEFDTNLLEITEINNELMQWITENETVISRIELLPHSKVLIPSGIHVRLPEGIFLNGSNKSGIASKRGLLIGAQTIDQDYEGEIHINLMNPTNEHVFIAAGEKIVQFIPYFQPVMHDVVEYKSKEELYKDFNSERGEGGFGSSGTK